MRHFIAYHNTEKMGRALTEGNPLRVLTNGQTKHLLEQTVWFVVGEGTRTRGYSLGSVFRVDEVGDTDTDGFKHFASGPGHVFAPPVPIKDKSWFPEIMRVTGRFGFGVQQVKDAAVVTGLTAIAADAGYQVPEMA